jgi:hypothetical protein
MISGVFATESGAELSRIRAFFSKIPRKHKISSQCADVLRMTHPRPEHDLAPEIDASRRKRTLARTNYPCNSDAFRLLSNVT